MRTITKLSEPPSLAELRSKPGAVFDERGLAFASPVEGGNPMLSSVAKQELRERLWEEQRGLCCYCCNGIIASESGMRIEHWKPLSKYPQHQLDYWNLMAACPGNEGQPGQEHCDVCKGNEELSKNPSNPHDRIDEIVRYLGNGEVRSSHAAFDSELGENPWAVKTNYDRVLNLNIAFLRNNRIGAMDALQAGFKKRGNLERDTLERLLWKRRGGEGGTLEPFSPVAVWWLKKRLQRD
ncbi:MAG: retron system putative HNH endonuclease [Verrucomicrobiota bacterium]